MAEQPERAALQGEPWARDASPYSAHHVGELGVLLVGDAASFIDPLSSFGVKKALASAWLAAVAAHTSLLDSERQAVARDFFSNWERGIYATHLRRSRDFAEVRHRLKHDGGYEALRASLTQEKALDWLLKEAKPA